jgi:hypothetical protein
VQSDSATEPWCGAVAVLRGAPARVHLGVDATRAAGPARGLVARERGRGVVGRPTMSKLARAFPWAYRLQLEEAEVGPTSGPTRCLSHSGAAALRKSRTLGALAADGTHLILGGGAEGAHAGDLACVTVAAVASCANSASHARALSCGGARASVEMAPRWANSVDNR